MLEVLSFPGGGRMRVVDDGQIALQGVGDHDRVVAVAAPALGEVDLRVADLAADGDDVLAVPAAVACADRRAADGAICGCRVGVQGQPVASIVQKNCRTVDIALHRHRVGVEASVQLHAGDLTLDQRGRAVLQANRVRCDDGDRILAFCAQNPDVGQLVAGHDGRVAATAEVDPGSLEIDPDGHDGIVALLEIDVELALRLAQNQRGVVEKRAGNLALVAGVDHRLAAVGGALAADEVHHLGEKNVDVPLLGVDLRRPGELLSRIADVAVAALLQVKTRDLRLHGGVVGLAQRTSHLAPDFADGCARRVGSRSYGARSLRVHLLEHRLQEL